MKLVLILFKVGVFSCDRPRNSRKMRGVVGRGRKLKLQGN